LSDLDELPSLKEFEALAREALGSDEGVCSGGRRGNERGDLPSADTAAAAMEAREELLEERRRIMRGCRRLRMRVRESGSGGE